MVKLLKTEVTSDHVEDCELDLEQFYYDEFIAKDYQNMPAASPQDYYDLIEELETTMDHQEARNQFMPHEKNVQHVQNIDLSPEQYYYPHSWQYSNQSSFEDSSDAHYATSDPMKVKTESKPVQSIPPQNDYVIRTGQPCVAHSGNVTDSAISPNSYVTEAVEKELQQAMFSPSRMTEQSPTQLSEYDVNERLSREYNFIVESQEVSRFAQQISSQSAYDVDSDGNIFDMDEDSSDTDFLSWTRKHPENWNTSEVLDWLYYSADHKGLDCAQLRGEAFRTVTGADLCQMGPEEFNQLEPAFGMVFYSAFRELISGLQFSIPHDSSYPSEQPEFEPSLCIPPISTDQHVYQQYSDNNKIAFHNTDSPTYTAYADQHSVESLYVNTHETYHPSHSRKSNQGHGYHYAKSHPYLVTGSEYRHYDMSPCSSSTSPRIKSEEPVLPPKRRPGRPRIKSLPTEEELQAQREKKAKNQHLWEFIWDMLRNPHYNPQILKWENQKEGVFRFVQSETVAHLWGTLKNNENMTYEKLSRAMRHYYKRGILERVEGRRLVYKFSQCTIEKMRERHLNTF